MTLSRVAHIYEHVCLLFEMLLGVVQALASASSGRNSSLPYSPSAYACIVRTLGKTVVPLTTNGAPKVYKQASTVLLKAYINRSKPLAKMLLHENSRDQDVSGHAGTILYQS